MPIRCEVILRRNARPPELMSLGKALERWCHQEIKDEGVTRRVDSQALSDLLQGKMPQPFAVEALLRPDEPDSEVDRHAVELVVRGGPSYDRTAIIQGLRREIPHELVEDILVAGKSWLKQD